MVWACSDIGAGDERDGDTDGGVDVHISDGELRCESAERNEQYSLPKL